MNASVAMTSPVNDPPEAAASPPEDEESRALMASTAATATTATTITIPSVLVFISSPSRPKRAAPLGGALCVQFTLPAQCLLWAEPRV